MKHFLESCLAVFVLVATVCCNYVPGRSRPSFGSKYVVYGDSKDTVCDQGSCRSRSRQIQYYQNLAKRIPLRINTNHRNVYEKIFYQRSVFDNRLQEYTLDVSTNQCKVTPVSRSINPFLHVPATFSYHRQATVEGKLCEVWRSSSRPTYVETWYVYYNAYASPPRHEPARYVAHFKARGPGSLSLLWVTSWRGYSTTVADSTFKLPSQC